MLFCRKRRNQSIFATARIKTGYPTTVRIKYRLYIINQECDYDRALERANLSTLFQRREDSCVQLITKMLDPAHKLHHLVPPCLSDLYHDRNTRSDSNQMYNYKLKTERFKNGPIVYAISRFNLSVYKSFIRL